MRVVINLKLAARSFGYKQELVDKFSKLTTKDCSNFSKIGWSKNKVNVSDYLSYHHLFILQKL